MAHVPHLIVSLPRLLHGLISHGNVRPFHSLPITTLSVSKPLVTNLDPAKYWSNCHLAEHPMSCSILAPGVHYSMRNGAHLLYCWEARQVQWEDAAPHQMQTELLSTEFRNHVSARLQISHTQFSQSLVRGHHSPINCWRQGPGQWWLNSLLTTVHAVITCVCIFFLTQAVCMCPYAVVYVDIV